MPCMAYRWSGSNPARVRCHQHCTVCCHVSVRRLLPGDIMKVILDAHACLVEREPGDRKLYQDSLLFHVVRNELRRQGFDVVKRLMWKDGHLTDDSRHYVRERSWKFAVFFESYQLRNAVEDYNRGSVILNVTRWGDPRNPAFSCLPKIRASRNPIRITYALFFQPANQSLLRRQPVRQPVTNILYSTSTLKNGKIMGKHGYSRRRAGSQLTSYSILPGSQ